MALMVALCRRRPSSMIPAYVKKYQSRSWQPLSLIIAGFPLEGDVEVHSFVNTFHVVLVKHVSVTQQS